LERHVQGRAQSPWPQPWPARRPDAPGRRRRRRLGLPSRHARSHPRTPPKNTAPPPALPGRGGAPGRPTVGRGRHTTMEDIATRCVFVIVLGYDGPESVCERSCSLAHLSRTLIVIACHYPVH